LTGCYEGIAELDADPAVFGRSTGSSTGEQGDGIASLTVSVTSTRLEVGQVVDVNLTAQSHAGETLQDVSAEWHSSNEDVAVFQSPARLEIVGQGDVEIWAAADSIESNRLRIEAELLDPSDTAFVIVEPRQIALADGDTASLQASVRSSSGRTRDGVAVEWSSSDTSVATVDADGRVTAKGEGSTWVSASVEAGETLASKVVVTPQDDWLRPRILRPSSHIVARGELLDVQVELRRSAVEGGYGSPVTPSVVEVLVDGSVVGEASIEWDVSHYELDPGSLEPGPHRLAARMTLNGDSYETPERMLVVEDAPQASFADYWENLSGAPQQRWALDDRLDPTNGNPPALAVDSQNRVFVAWEKAGRDRAQIYVHRWDGDDGRWRYLRNYEGGGGHGLQLRHWSSQYEYFPSRSAQFVDLAVDGQDRLLLAFTQEAVDTGGNGDEREKRWFDVFVARYEQGFGPDGTAGWRLLTSGAQDYIVSPPEAEDPQHPVPLDVDEHDDVFTPKLIWDAQRDRTTVAWISTPFPRQEMFLDVRYWSEANSKWVTVGERLALDGDVPELRDAFVDPSGDIVAVVANMSAAADERYEVWVLDVENSEWSRLTESGRVLDLAPAGSGTAVGVAMDEGFLRGVNVQSVEDALAGRILNRSAWTDAKAPVFARGGGQPALIWFEGPTGSRQWIHGATYAGSGWEPLDVDLYTRTRGHTRPGAVVGSDGRLIIARQAPHPEKDNEFSLHVVRSLEPIFE
jgi:hypothetical protein